MDLPAALSLLYAASGVAACAFYLPQLRLLSASADARRAMAPLTWGGWMVVGWVGIAYAVLVVGQREMIAVMGANTLCQSAVFAAAVGQRLADRRYRKRPRA